MPITPAEKASVQAAVKRLIKLLGPTQSEAAKQLKVTQPTMSAYLNGTHFMSAARAIRCERLSDGQVKASELCPDLKQVDLPETLVC